MLVVRYRCADSARTYFEQQSIDGLYCVLSLISEQKAAPAASTPAAAVRSPPSSPKSPKSESSSESSSYSSSSSTSDRDKGKRDEKRKKFPPPRKVEDPRVFVLNRGTFVFGSNPGVSAEGHLLRDPYVSKSHFKVCSALCFCLKRVCSLAFAQIHEEHSRYFISDEASTNGTFLRKSADAQLDPHTGKPRGRRITARSIFLVGQAELVVTQCRDADRSSFLVLYHELLTLAFLSSSKSNATDAESKSPAVLPATPGSDALAADSEPHLLVQYKVRRGSIDSGRAAGGVGGGALPVLSLGPSVFPAAGVTPLSPHSPALWHASHAPHASHSAAAAAAAAASAAGGLSAPASPRNVGSRSRPSSVSSPPPHLIGHVPVPATSATTSPATVTVDAASSARSRSVSPALGAASAGAHAHGAGLSINVGGSHSSSASGRSTQKGRS